MVLAIPQLKKYHSCENFILTSTEWRNTKAEAAQVLKTHFVPAYQSCSYAP